MRQLYVTLLLLSIILCGTGCKQAQEKSVAREEKSAVQEQIQEKAEAKPAKKAETKPQNPVKLASEDAKLKIVAGAENVLGIELENKVPIRGVQFALQGVKITELRTTERTKGYISKFNEATGIIILVDMSGKTIPPGTGLIAEVVCDKGGSAQLSEIKLAR